MNSEVRRFDNLDILRGFAALAVFGYHLIPTLGISIQGNFSDLLKMPFIAGWIGVDLFLVISGCVISLCIFEAVDARIWSPFRFMFQRLARIAPLHWLCLAIASIVMWEQWTAERWMAFAGTASFIHNLRFDWYGQFDGPSWSIALEMQFYLLMAISAAKLRHANKYAVLGVATLISCCWKLSVMGSFGFHVDLTNPAEARRLVVLVTQLPSVLDQFAVGYFVARLLVDSFGQTAQPAANNERRKLAVRLIVLVLAFLMTLYFAFWHAALHPEQGNSYEDWTYVFIRILFGWVFGALVWSVCVLETSSATLVLRWLGERSYGIYLWHSIVIVCVESTSKLSHVEFFGVTVVGVIVLSHLSWRFVERPVVRWAKLRSADVGYK